MTEQNHLRHRGHERPLLRRGTARNMTDQMALSAEDMTTPYPAMQSQYFAGGLSQT